jgi:diguanylate cyclase (GGDEF)-like protein
VPRRVVSGNAGFGSPNRLRAVARCQYALLAVAAFASCGRAPDLRQTVLTSTSQVRLLSAPQVRLGVPVRIQGILTYFDGISSYCFVQDSQGGIRVSFATGQVPPATGWRVEVVGVAAAGGATPAIAQARISAIAADSLPRPISVSPARLGTPEYQYKRVAVSGVVRSVDSQRPGLMTLEILAARSTVRVRVPSSIAVANEDWTDADVRASGVLGESPVEARSGSPGGSIPTLFVSDPGGLETIRLGRPPGELPESKINSLLAMDPTQGPAHRVRVRGVPYAPGQGEMAILDQTGHIPVRIGHLALDPNSTALDVAGFLVWENGRPLLDGAVPVDDIKVADRDQVLAPGSTLTSALQVHQLPLTAAQRAYPVQLRGVVTYFDPGNHLLFVQDPSDGIFVELSEKEKGSMRAGDAVEVTGVTTADFAPDVAGARIRVLGHPGLPVPGTGRLGSASWGREDCHWLELEGIVQRVAQGRGDALLTLAWGTTSYKAHVLASAESLAPLLDAHVTLRGVCGALFNTKRQMLGIQMFVPGSECIRVLRAPSPDPFSVPPTPIADLLRFSRASDMGHRVRLHGTVTYSNFSGPTWVRDATGGVMIQDHQPAALAAGDQVDVVGFPEIDGFSPALRGASVKRLQSGAPPAPVRITAADALKGDFDGQLVQIEGKLIDRLQQPGDQALAVASGDTAFTAHLAGAGAVPPLQPGTRLRLTGICSVEVEQSSDLILPHMFRLLLRSPADVVIVGRPPWLTAGRLVPVLSGAFLLTIAALAWVGLLRKRVRAQTFALRAQTVQLQAAHLGTRNALRKAHEAESLDMDSKRILELIARDEPVDLIIDNIAEAVALHSEGAVCAILLGGLYGPRVCVVPAMPAGWQDALGQIPIDSISCGPEIQAAKLFSADASWVDFIHSQKNQRFRTVCSSPIVVDADAAGVIAAFFRDEKGSAAEGGVQGAQLSLWCNIAALALERRRLHDQLSYRAQHDGLTGLPNRALLYERLETEIERASHCGGLLGVLYVDLNGFKQINDTFGHDAGDTVLKEATSRMTQGVRRGDTVARIGGDEFVVLLPLLGRREDAQQIADKMAAALREPIYTNQQRLSVSASIGIAVWPLDADRPDPLLRFADARMYGEKRRRWYDPEAASPWNLPEGETASGASQPAEIRLQPNIT